MSFLVELRRRNVIRVAIAYAAFAWLLVQVVETVLPFFGFSDDAIRIIFIVLAIGFLPTLVFAWAFEMTPEGLKLERDVDRTASVTRQTGKKLDRAIMLTLGVALAYFAIDKFVLDPARDAEQLELARAAGEEAGRAEALETDIPDNSIAVLPFLNMSNDPDNEYFSDGVSEELLNLLAQAGGLIVASRTSSFYFKDKSVDIPQVADRLNVRHVLEGSVRKTGNQIRVTAQLIDTRSDSHLWSQTYDRELTDIFAVQDEIAQRIVDELRNRLSSLVDIGQPDGLSQTANVEAYQLYLRGLSLFRLRGIDNLRQSAGLFRQALEIDPDYARAWANLAAVYLLTPFYVDEPRPPWLERAAGAAEKAIELDPSLAAPHAVLAGVYQYSRGVPMERAVTAFRKAISIDPEYVTARQWYGEFLMLTGQVRELLTQLEAAHRLDPLAPVVNAALAWAHLYVGDFNQAEQYANTALELGMGGTWAEDVLGQVYILTRQYDKALEVFEGDHPDFELNRLVVKALQDPARVPEALSAIDSVDYSRISYWPVELIMLVGESDLALDLALQGARDGTADLRALWRPGFIRMAGDPRFKEIVEVVGLPAYWDQTGWSDFCRRQGEDFSCDAAYFAER